MKVSSMRTFSSYSFDFLLIDNVLQPNEDYNGGETSSRTVKKTLSFPGLEGNL